MTETELIVAVLAAGAGAGITHTASSAIGDAYAELTDLLARRLSGYGRGRWALDAPETAPAVLQARIGRGLTALSGAARRGVPAGHEPLGRVG
jgi:hypothetical protein